MTTTAWTTVRERIPWHPSPGWHTLPLGRNVYHDSRNRAYAWKRTAVTLKSQLWPRQIPILDQGNVGSCTGNEQVGALGTGPVFDALPAGHPPLDENLALVIYSGAETIDGDGPYPPNDYGSSGPSAAQVARKMGLIAGYLHCFSLNDVLEALETGPVGIGSNWYDSMDSPSTSEDSAGLVSISPGAQVRGGHEYLCRGKDMDRKLVYCDNSWGPGWGSNGSFSYSFATLERLLAEQGDGTVSVPLTAPAPVPSPVPSHEPADVEFAGVLHPWLQLHHIGGNGRVAKAAEVWMKAKGL